MEIKRPVLGAQDAPPPPPASAQLARDMARRFVELVDAVDEDQWDDPVRGLPGWSVRDLVVHVATAAPLYLAAMDDPRHWYPSIGETARCNDERLEVERRRSDDDLRGLLSSETDRLAERVEGDPNTVVPFHFGCEIPRHLITATLVGEFAVHGFDLARTIRRPWHLGSAEADVVLERNVAVFDRVMRRDRARNLTATYELVVRSGATHHLHIVNGHATTDIDPDAPVDCRMNGTAEAWLLVTSGRRSPLRFALTGRMRVSGRRPWLATKLDRLVDPI